MDADLYGGIAQLGERLPCKQEASGSIPLISTKQDQIEVFGQASEHFDLTLKKVGRMHLEN